METRGTGLQMAFICEPLLYDRDGVGRLFADLAGEMHKRGHRVTVIVKPSAGTESEGLPATPLPEGCELLQADLDAAEGRDRVRVRLLECGCNVLVGYCAGRGFLRFPRLLEGTGIPLVSAESLHPRILTHERWSPYEHYAALACCDRIQVPLEPYKACYPKALHGRIDVIGSPAPEPRAVDWQARAEKTERTLLFVGCFHEQDKRGSLLLRAWRLLKDEFPDWSLTMVGDGQGWDLYHAMAEAMGREPRVSFPGNAADPDAYYGAADLFCMPSRQEAFPLALGEAAAHSLPLVGFRNCEAARELIPPGGGALAEEETPTSLAAALRELMAASPEARRNAGETARDSFQARYGGGAVYDQWERLLLRAAKKRGHTRMDRLRRNEWNAALLNESALELLSRPETMAPPGQGTLSPAAALARLRSEHDALAREHRRLQKKYDALVRQLYPADGRRR